jgi:hypothetical protein
MQMQRIPRCNLLHSFVCCALVKLAILCGLLYYHCHRVKAHLQSNKKIIPLKLPCLSTTATVHYSVVLSAALSLNLYEKCSVL